MRIRRTHNITAGRIIYVFCPGERLTSSLIILLLYIVLSVEDEFGEQWRVCRGNRRRTA